VVTVIFSRFERNSVEEMKNILISDSTLSIKDKVQLEKMIARLEAKKSPHLSDYEINQFKQKQIDLKKTRIFVLLTWPLSILAILYFGVVPGRGGDIYWAEKPGWFILCIVVWVSVGLYFCAERDDT
jgi:hypothetical protein